MQLIVSATDIIGSKCSIGFFFVDLRHGLFRYLPIFRAALQYWIAPNVSLFLSNCAAPSPTRNCNGVYLLGHATFLFEHFSPPPLTRLFSDRSLPLLCIAEIFAVFLSCHFRFFLQLYPRLTCSILMLKSKHGNL